MKVLQEAIKGLDETDTDIRLLFSVGFIFGFGVGLLSGFLWILVYAIYAYAWADALDTRIQETEEEMNRINLRFNYDIEEDLPSPEPKLVISEAQVIEDILPPPPNPRRTSSLIRKSLHPPFSWLRRLSPLWTRQLLRS